MSEKTTHRYETSHLLISFDTSEEGISISIRHRKDNHAVVCDPSDPNGLVEAFAAVDRRAYQRGFGDGRINALANPLRPPR